MNYSSNAIHLGPAIAILFIAIGTSGCAETIPSFDLPRDVQGEPTVRSIVRRIRCELQDIVSSNSQLRQEVIQYNDVHVGIELSLSVTEDGGLSPTFSAVSQPLTVSTGFNVDQSRSQNFTQELQFALSEFSGQSQTCTSEIDTNLSGNLGLKQAYDLAFSSGPYWDWNTKGSTGVFGGSITFNVTKAITATGPTWKLNRFVGPGNLLTLSDKNTDKLTFAFVKGKKAGKTSGSLMAQETQTVISRVIQNQIATSLNTIAQAVR